MNKLLVIIVLLSFFDQSSGQTNTNFERRKQAYINETDDSIKIERHLDYIHALLLDYERQKETVSEIEKLKKETQNTKSAEIIFWTLYYEGLSEYNNYHFINSIIAIEKLNKMVTGGGISETAKKAAPSTLITLGLSYSKLFDLENAQTSYQKAIKGLQSVNDSSNIVVTYINLGYLFSKSQDWAGAIKEFENGIRYINADGKRFYAVPIYTSLSIAQARLGNINKAAAALDKATHIKNEFSDVVANTFYELAKGENEMLKKNYPEAIINLTAAIGNSRRWGDSSTVAESFESLGRAYWKSGNSVMALQCLQYSRFICKENKIPDQEKIALKTLFDFYKTEGSYKEAAETAESLLALSDSLAKLLSNNSRIIQNTLFQTEQSAKEISALQQENELARLRLRQKNIINYILAGAAVSIFLISMLSLRNYRQKKELQQQRISELEKEKQLFATEAVLKVQEEERSRLAQDLHDGLGGILSGIKYSFSNMKENLIMSPENLERFQRGLDMLDSSINELRRVAHSMMPEALMKFGLNAALRDFCAGINSSGVINVIYQSYGIEDLILEPGISVSIYRIIQELLNNSIKHAVATNALVQLNKEDNCLLITIEDDGKGFDLSSLEQSNGIGWLNIQNRLKYLKAKLDLHSAPGEGTSIHIEIPV